jgi:hypothetical protein
VCGGNGATVKRDGSGATEFREHLRQSLENPHTDRAAARAGSRVEAVTAPLS